MSAIQKLDIQEYINNELGCKIRITDRNGDPWFIAKDVAEALEYSNTRQAIRLHCKGGLEISLPSKSGLQSTKIIPESDVYRLIMRSKKPDAEKFADWIFETVLPSIRKHGAYLTPQKAFDILNNPNAIISLAREVARLDDENTSLKKREEIFGNRTPYGEISPRTGKPKTHPVRGHLRSARNIVIKIEIPDNQRELFEVKK